MPATFSNYKSIEEILLDLGKITQQQLEAIRITSVNTGQSTKDTIRDGNYITAEDYALAYSKAYNVEYVSLKGKKIDPALFDVLPLDYIKKYEAVPFNRTSEVLQVAGINKIITFNKNFYEYFDINLWIK